jgi:hypothetical protein
MPKGYAPVAMPALVQHSSVAQHWQSDDMLAPHISHLILADCTAPGDLKLQKLPRGLRDFPPFSSGNQGGESILQRCTALRHDLSAVFPPDAPPATHHSLRLRCSRRSPLQPCDPVFIGSGSAGGARHSGRSADAAQVCSNVGLVVVDGAFECSFAIAARQIVSGRW